MTTPHDAPPPEARTPVRIPAQEPPGYPWDPPTGRPAQVPPPGTAQSTPGPGSSHAASGTAPAAPPGYPAAGYEHVADPSLPGYLHAPGAGPASPFSPYAGAPGWSSWDPGPGGGTNGLAVAAFVASWVFWPAALVMGSVALLSQRRRGQTGRGWAVAAIVLSLVWAVASAVVLAAVVAFLGSGQLAALTGASRGTAADLQAVAIGQCFAEQGDEHIVVDCALPHDGEVFLTGSVVGTGTLGFPGELLLQAEAEEICDAAFAAYVGLEYERSQWHYSSWVPSEESWADGDRAATCAIVPFDAAALTGSAAGSGL